MLIQIIMTLNIAIQTFMTQNVVIQKFMAQNVESSDLALIIVIQKFMAQNLDSNSNGSKYWNWKIYDSKCDSTIYRWSNIKIYASKYYNQNIYDAKCW